MRKFVWVVASILFALVVGAGCSSDDPSRDLSLLGPSKKGGKPGDPETERLRRMQLVRVIEKKVDDSGNPVDVSDDATVGDIDAAIRQSPTLCKCPVDQLADDPDVVVDDFCFDDLCRRLQDACVAKLMLSMALPQTKEFAVPPFIIPIQEAGPNAALAVHAADLAQKAASRLKVSVDLMLGVIDHTDEVDDGGALFRCEGLDGETIFDHGVTKIEFATSTFGELYHLEKDAIDVAVTSILAVADSQLGSSASFDEALARVLAGSALSRVAAAHLLVGGDVGIQGDTTKPFCKDRLPPEVRAAVAVFRDAAISPAVLADESIDINTLVNGLAGQPTDGSVRQRIGQFYNYADLLSGRGVDARFGIDLGTFQRARAYMIDEHRAFGRSDSALLDPRVLPSGDNSTYPRYAGTATDPAYPPTGLYAGTVRFAGLHFPAISHVWPEDYQEPSGVLPRLHYEPTVDFEGNPQDTGMQPHAHFEDAALSQAAAWLSAVGRISSDTIRRLAMAPLAMLLNSEERIGRLVIGSGGERFTTISARGFRSTDGLLLAPSDDALRCAATGKIEGVDCTIDDGVTPLPAGAKNPVRVIPLNQPGSAAGTFDQAAETTILANSFPTGRIYLLRPISGRKAAPGNYESILAFTRDGASGNAFFDTASFPITPALDKRADDILAPSKKWCAMPRIHCSGGSFDDRLPLDDELASQMPGVENSWKHYLTLAMEAAQRADQLGTDYINAGVEAIRRNEEVEVRTEQQRERADEEITKLQSICGTNVNPRKLLDLLSTGVDAAGKSAHSDALNATPACTAAHPCTCDATHLCAAGFECVSGQCVCNPDPPDPGPQAAGTSASVCGVGFQCLAGQCVVNLMHFAADHGDDPDLQRIADCLNGAPADAFISVGTAPLCLWSNTKNPHRICEEADGTLAAPGSVCPRVNLPQPNGSRLDCIQVVHPPTTDGTYTIAETTALGFFDTLHDDPQAAKRCSSLALVRNDKTAYPVHNQEIFARGWFTLPRLRQAQLGMAQSYDPAGVGTGIPSYVAVNANGNVYKTGSTATGPAPNIDWPCKPRRGETCPSVCNDGGMETGLAKPCSLFCRQRDCTNPSAREQANQLMLRAVSAARYILSDPGQDPYMLPATHVTNLERTCARTSDAIAARGGKVPLVSPTLTDDPPTLHCNPAFTEISVPGGRAFQFDFKEKDGTTNAYFRNTNVSTTNHIPGLVGFFPAPYHLDPTSQLGQMPARPADPRLLTNETNNAGSRTGQSTDSWIRAALKGADGFASVRFQPTGTDSPITLSGDDLLNGYELLCDAMPGPGGITLGRPPVVQSVGDLSKVGEYFRLLADQIRDRASLTVFSNVPTSAQNGLSAFAAYPKFGGAYGKQLSALAGALERIREFGPLVASEIEQYGYDLRHLQTILQIHHLDEQVARLQFLSTLTSQLMNCASSINVGSLVGSFGMTSVMTCTNALMQIDIAGDLAKIQEMKAELEADLAVGDFGATFGKRATSLQTLSIHLATAEADFNAALSEIETLRQSAASSLARAVYLASFQAAHQAEVTAVIGNLFDGKQRRYTDALENAKRLAFLAGRAIEQRLGVRLADLTEDLPLVDAPSRWEPTVCSFTGLNFDSLRTASPSAAATQFAGGFITDYVNKLSNVVESYRLENSFHEGADTAVISLRDDLMNVRASCEVTSPNILFHAGDLGTIVEPGWVRSGCPTTIVDGVELPAEGCVTVARMDGTAPPFGDPSLAAGVNAFNLTFGTPPLPDGGTADPAIVQNLDLLPGRYRFTWYTREGSIDVEGSGMPVRVGGASAEMIRGDLPIQFEPLTTDNSIPAGGGWGREVRRFTVPAPTKVRIGFHKPQTPHPSGALTIAAPMLELLPNVGNDFELIPFANTTDKLTMQQPACEDTDGSVFRSTRWSPRCVRLCPDGFSSNCTEGRSKEYCFREASFSISQRDIQLGKALNVSGFARGNFNYRIESVGINFVGTNTRDCENSSLPSTCFGSAFIPYTIEHNGPFYIRNAVGDDVEALLFDGKIEHARGLASERYLTNPLSSTDQSLIDQYLRGELIGRPLDGTFVLRVWEEPGVNFDAIADVQLVLKYRYWTKLQ